MDQQSDKQIDKNNIGTNEQIKRQSDLQINKYGDQSIDEQTNIYRKAERQTDYWDRWMFKWTDLQANRWTDGLFDRRVFVFVLII